jgi:hypothetical protein
MTPNKWLQRTVLALSARPPLNHDVEGVEKVILSYIFLQQAGC